ncbi:putative zinc finger protein 840 [Vanessa cardui]|uniref:putative zinc finger protein 840 n=1 Tax=Vanessa cardui TaxID=171605 RepID=UPI001F143E61|nr:putative zinc finger protein 840 [Vanessa cardui]
MTLAERINAAHILKNTTVTPFTYLLFPSSYKCLFCDVKTFEIHSLLEHSRSHVVPNHDEILKDILKKGKKKIKVDISNLKCRICDQSFVSLDDIQEHLTNMHNVMFTDAGVGMISFNLQTTDDLFTCHVCSNTFHSFFLLNKHISVHYSNAMCDSCGKGFLSYQRLMTHMESHRNGTYPCEKCKKTFPSISKLKYHNDKFHGTLGKVKLAKCHKCLARFEHHYEKIKHLKDTHGISFSFTCDTCNCVFKTRHSLNMHVVKNHTQNIACEICKKTFSERYHLKKHMATHSQERNFVCPLCKKCYRYEKTLKQHLKIHNPEWKFSCSVCWTSFSNKIDYKTHKTTMHL